MNLSVRERLRAAPVSGRHDVEHARRGGHRRVLFPEERPVNAQRMGISHRRR